jgi:tetratricopeptide (TPR) repeat protein
MKCPRCGQENPASLKFCGECGARLASLCSACGAPNAPSQKFCGECGARLAQDAGATRFASPGAYTPKHLAEKILTSRGSLGVLIQYTAGLLGSVYARSGHLAEGVSLAEEGARTADTIGPGVYRSSTFARLGEACLLADRRDDARKFTERALTLAREMGQRGSEAWALCQLGEVLAADEPFRQAAALADELGMRPLLARCHLGLGSLDRRTGRLPEAREHLAAATTMFGEMQMRSWLEKANAERRATE